MRLQLRIVILRIRDSVLDAYDSRTVLETETFLVVSPLGRARRSQGANVSGQ